MIIKNLPSAGRIPVLVAAAAFALAACGSESADAGAGASGAGASGAGAESNGAGASADASAFPVTITDNLGTATIEAEPQRVVVLGDFSDLDSVLALGVQPVAFGFTQSWGTGLATWQIDADAAEITQFDASGPVDAEDVAVADPDLIIGMEYLAEPSYAALPELAPVVTLSWEMTWSEQLGRVAEALGRADRAAELEQDVSEALAAGADKLAAAAKMPIMVGSYYADRLYVQGEKSSVTGLLRGLGLAVKTTTAEQMDDLSLENVPLLADAEIILSLATDPAATQTAEASSLWKALPAVQAGRYTALTGFDARAVGDGFNALSYQTVIDLLVETVDAAAAGHGTPLGVS